MIEIKTMDLSFCGDEAHNVVNQEAKEHIIQSLKKHNISINDKRAYILNNKSLHFLEKTQHIISIKSSGTNYYLYFTNINSINYCFFIDRKIKQGYTYPRIISVKYRFSDTIFKDTLLDGELIKSDHDSSDWMFLVSDILICEGEKLESNIINRFNKLYSILKNNYTPDEVMDICPIVVKRLFLYSEYDYLITQFIPSLSYKTKGLYFNSLNTKHANQLFLFNNAQNKPTTQFKEKKMPKTDSLDNYKVFRLETTDKPDVYDLYCFDKDKNEPEKYGMACVPNLRSSKNINKLLSGKDSIYVDCKFNPKFDKYEPIKISEIDNDRNLTLLSSLS